VALVFDSQAQLTAWMGGTTVPGVPYTPANLRPGWKALIRSEDEPDRWWDGSHWLDIEAKTDLSAYRTSAAQDLIDALFAPINSPVFTGIPQTPRPSGTVPEQIEQVGRVNDLFTLYRPSAAQDLIDALFAPIHSPVFTGIPQVPVPDYSVPLQAVPVSEVKYILEAINDILYGKRRRLERGGTLKAFYRQMERGERGIRRKTERAII
jgi:hypothetical protein